VIYVIKKDFFFLVLIFGGSNRCVRLGVLASMAATPLGVVLRMRLSGKTQARTSCAVGMSAEHGPNFAASSSIAIVTSPYK
jgi:hypothetical protein